MTSSRILFKLPKLDLPELPDAGTRQTFENLAVRLDNLAKDGGKNGLAFLERVRIIKATSHNEAALISKLNGMRDIRVALYLWGNDDDFLKKIPPTPLIFQKFLKIAPELSRLTIQDLVSFYFDKYDLLERSAFKFLQDFLRRLLTRNPPVKRPNSMSEIVRNADSLFKDNTPEHIVSLSRIRGQSVIDSLDSINIPKGQTNRFRALCLLTYYIKTIESLRVGDDHAVIKEIQKASVYNEPYNNGELLGHHVVRALIDKCRIPQKAMPEHWVNAVLSVARDPRIPNSHPNFRRWWSILGEERMRWMRQWLSRLDLKAFLAALEDYANETGGDVARMYPARAQFLQNLLAKDMISDSRLFLGAAPADAIRRRFTKEELPNYADLADGTTAAIYLRVNNLHLVEGTHNFALYLFTEMPKSSKILDYNHTFFKRNSIGMNIINELKENQIKFSNVKIARIVHNNNWRCNTFKFFQACGVKIDPSDLLMSRDEYLKCY